MQGDKKENNGQADRGSHGDARMYEELTTKIDNGEDWWRRIRARYERDNDKEDKEEMKEEPPGDAGG